MPVIVSKSDIICKVEDLINRGKIILIFDRDDPELLNALCKGIYERKLTNTEIWHCMEPKVSRAGAKHVSPEEMAQVLEMYRLYEFSDNVMVIDGSSLYGTLFNYVRTGILSVDEMADALLHRLS